MEDKIVHIERRYVGRTVEVGCYRMEIMKLVRVSSMKQYYLSIHFNHTDYCPTMEESDRMEDEIQKIEEELKKYFGVRVYLISTETMWPNNLLEIAPGENLEDI